jgi:predicted glycogen debranching enzyme
MTFPSLGVPAPVASDIDAGTRREWLETNGLGSFAMGTVSGPSTRRYHAILCAATRPPLARMVMVNRLEEAVVIHGTRFPLSSNYYPGVVHPDGYRLITGFRLDPWPVWTYRLGDALVERSIFMPHERQMTVVTWRLVEGARARLFVQPLISGRDSNALHMQNEILRRDVESGEGLVVFHTYPDIPKVFVHHNGLFVAKPDWYRSFEYPVERERGLEYHEDLFSPGELGFDLVPGTDAVAIFSLEPGEPPSPAALRERERVRRDAVIAPASSVFSAHLHAAADQFIVRRGEHRTVIAGYPWFTDWGRDTFIALPGLALATGRHDLARELLLAWAPHVRDGMIPCRFPDSGEEPEYNAVDASLWYVLAAERYAQVAPKDEPQLELVRGATRAIIEGYLNGTRYGIGVDDDGLLHAAAPGVQLTWMDAKVGDWVVTPRAGKPVEVQALWVAALEATARLFPDDAELAHELAERAAWARSSFAAAFWNADDGWLYDVIDGPNRHNRDRTLRPNQLYALGLCAPLVDAERAERVLRVCEEQLVTPVGLRTRARDAGYIGRYGGDPRTRDAAYHQGTVWPFLLGIYADACLRVRGEAPLGLLDGVRAHLANYGVGQICEIYDGDSPHTPRGCPAQAWSVAEALRIVATYG